MSLTGTARCGAACRVVWEGWQAQSCHPDPIVPLGYFEAPTPSDTLEVLVAKIEKEVTASVAIFATDNPIVGGDVWTQTSRDFVKLTPSVSVASEPPLISIPTFVVHSADAVTGAAFENKLSDVILVILRELE